MANIDFPTFLKEARLKSGLSQQDVAQTLNYTTAQFISNWERGVSAPPIDVLKTLSRLYKVSPQELYELYEDYTVTQVRLKFRKKFAKTK